jgi:hypothetical protein
VGENCTVSLVRKSEGNLLERVAIRWGFNIKMLFKELVWEGMVWIYVASDKVWRILGSQKMRELFEISEEISV